MNQSSTAQPRPDVSSTGQSATGAAHLERHFEACRAEYEAMLRSVGIQPGARVLDAGCGSGSYLPLLAELVGPAGAITALDLAPDNIAIVEERLETGDWPCPVTTLVASLADPLPYPDDSFDVVWCSATTQYLTDEELTRALAEMRRIVRPGGLVALKDFALGHWLPYLIDPAIYWRLIDHASRVDPQWHGMLRSHQLRRWLERSGFEAVWQQTTLIERWAPLGPAEAEHYGKASHWFADVALQSGVPQEDLVFWESLRDPLTSPLHAYQRDPDFHRCEGHVVAVGRVPA